MTCLVKRLVCLCYNVFVFFIGSHIANLVKNSACFLINLAERSFYKAVFIYLRKGCKIGDKTDVRTFRSLYRAHTSVMRIVNITNLEGRAVTGKSAGSERRKTALMGKLRQRVGLIHKLRKRRRAEEFLYGRHNRTDVYKRLGGNTVGILRLQGHFLTHNTLHTGYTYAELVLQKLTHRTDTAVAEMVYIVNRAHIVRKSQKIVYGSKYIVKRYMLRNKVVGMSQNCLAQLFLAVCFFKQLFKNLKRNVLVYAEPVKLAEFIGSEIGKIAKPYHTV